MSKSTSLAPSEATQTTQKRKDNVIVKGTREEPHLSRTTGAYLQSAATHGVPGPTERGELRARV